MGDITGVWVVSGSGISTHAPAFVRPSIFRRRLLCVNWGQTKTDRGNRTRLLDPSLRWSARKDVSGHHWTFSDHDWMTMHCDYKCVGYMYARPLSRCAQWLVKNMTEKLLSGGSQCCKHLFLDHRPLQCCVNNSCNECSQIRQRSISTCWQLMYGFKAVFTSLTTTCYWQLKVIRV